MTETLNLPVLPLDDVVVLPGMVVPVRLADTEARAAIDAAQASGTDQVLLVPRLDGKYAKAGTLGEIEQIGRLPGGAQAAVIRGVARVQIGAGTTGPGAALWVGATVLDETTDDKSGELAREYKSLMTTVLQRRGAWQVIDSVKQVDDPAELSDLAGYASYLNNEQKSWLLETSDVSERLTKLIGWVKDHLAELEVSESIQKDVQEGMEKQQREFLLRQQLAAVRKELAELDGTTASEEEDYRARVEAADLPDHVRKAALAEVDKLERTAEQSPEVGWIRTWLDTVLELPWNERTEDGYDL
ncbi:MAG TPA: LON peptidase substrate-binding domain-containing protein, partial [Kribbella sp.]